MILKSWVSLQEVGEVGKRAGAAAALEVGTIGRPQHGCGREKLIADAHRMRLIARRHGKLRGHGLERSFDNIAADPHSRIGLIDDRARLAEDLARLGDLAANADRLEDGQRRFMQRLDFVVGNELGGRQRVDELLPWHLGNGSAAAVADAPSPLRFSRTGSLQFGPDVKRGEEVEMSARRHS